MILIFIFANSQYINGQVFWNDADAFETKTFQEIVEETDAHYATYPPNTRKPGYKPYMRWKLSEEMRLGSNHEMVNSNAIIHQEYTKFLKENKKDGSRFSSGNWIEEGHYGYVQDDNTVGLQGRVNCIAFHPTDANTIYVGTAAGGLWRSTNDGVNWKPLTDGLPSIGISGITIDSNNPNRIWILTGDGNARHSWSIGVLYSSNGGSTWMKRGFNMGIDTKSYGYDLVANPENINTQFAVMNSGIYMTNDGWISSSQVDWPLTFDLEYKPGDTTVVYACANNGFRMSNNGGQNFASNDGAGVLPNSFQFSRAEVGVTPDNPNLVYLFYGGGDTGFPGFYKSEDSGVTWNMTTNTPNICSRYLPFQDSVNQAGYDHVLAIDPNDEDVIYTGGINVFKSSNGGDMFEVNAYWSGSDIYPYVHADIHALEFNNGSLYVGCDGGLFKTSDGGQTYQDLSVGLRISQYYYIDVTASKVIGGMQDNGSLEMNYNLENTAKHILGGDGFACAFNYEDPSIYYMSTQGYRAKYINGVYQKTITNDISGESWNEDFLMDPQNPEIMFTARNEVFRSNNSGDDWLLMDAFEDADSSSVTAMIQGISFRDRLYVAKENILMRSDNALSANPDFVDLSAEIPNNGKITDMAVNPANSTKLYIVFSGFDATNKVWFKNGLDANWVNLTGSLPNVPIYSIVYHEGSQNGLFIGTEIGVFYRDDNIGDWHYFGNNLPTVRVYDLKILSDGVNDKIFAATFGRGIWSSVIGNMDCALAYNLTEGNNSGDSNFDGVKVYVANQSIVSSRKIDGGIGTNVLYSAGDFIQLNPGFRAKHRSIFTAVLDGCSGVTMPSFQNEENAGQK